MNQTNQTNPYSFLRGIGVALITPFTQNNEIDYPTLENLIDHVIQENTTGSNNTKDGVDYIVVLGTTGESATLSKKERQDVFVFINEKNNGRIPLVAGVAGNNSSQVLEDLNTYDLSGYSTILSASPSYNKPSQAGIIAHYSSIADNSKLPVILYNVPSRTGSNMTAETTLSLSQHKNIIGIKEASGNLEQCIAISTQKSDDFFLISGDDLLTIPMISIGASGVISVVANAYPKEFSSLIRSYLETSNLDVEILKKLEEITPHLYSQGNPVGVKALMHELGLCEKSVRLPLVPGNKDLKESIKKHLW